MEKAFANSADLLNRMTGKEQHVLETCEELKRCIQVIERMERNAPTGIKAGNHARCFESARGQLASEKRQIWPFVRDEIVDCEHISPPTTAEFNHRLGIVIDHVEQRRYGHLVANVG